MEKYKEGLFYCGEKVKVRLDAIEVAEKFKGKIGEVTERIGSKAPYHYFVKLEGEEFFGFFPFVFRGDEIERIKGLEK